MKKIVKIIGFLLIAVLLVSCASGGRYKLIHENGQYYVMLDEVIDETGYTCIDFGDPTVVFGSFEEMISDIKTGNFTEEELVRLLVITPQWESRETQKLVDRVHFPNLDALLMPKVQEEYDQFKIELIAPDYKIICRSLSSDGENYPSYKWTASFLPVASETEVLNRLEQYKNNTSLVPMGRDEERKATVYGDEENPEERWVYDPVVVEGRTIYMVEDIINQEKDNWHVVIGVVDGEYCYEMIFYAYNGRPELEWYYSFGMEPYVG